jgi:hypothetical protein
MNRATKIKLSATQAANLHRDKCGLETISYSYLAGCLEAHIDKLCSELANYTPNASGRGEQETTYAHDGGELVVHYDYEAGEEATRDDPGCDPLVTVNSVYANGMDITYLLSDTDTMEHIIGQCYEEVEMSIKDAKADAAISRWESRRDDDLMEAA